MKPAESFAQQPIRSLQTMLRTIASVEPGQMNVMPDGIYGSQTAAAVRSFQRRQGLNPTGVVDEATFSEVYPTLLFFHEYEPFVQETHKFYVL